MKKTEFVLEAVIRRCREAYQARTPLIMIDTMETELVDEVARSGELVTLVRRPDKFSGSRELAYYEFIGRHPLDAELCANLYLGADKLAGVAGGCLEESGLPGMFVVQLNRTSWSMGSGESGDVAYLREYVGRYLRCADNNSPLRCSCVLLYGDVSFLPDDLAPYTEIVEVDYPTRREIIRLVDEMTRENRARLELELDLQDIAPDLAGFGLYEIKRLVNRLLWLDPVDGRPLIFNPEARHRTILEAKRQTLLRSGGLLELEKSEGVRLGGMQEFRRWVDRNRERMTAPADYLLERGVTPPKGVLLCGVPGCGKSEAARALYSEWNRDKQRGLPMVKLNIDRLMGGLVGESERNMREALRQAEAMAPCIVWIDELDKAFSGAAAASSGDSGTFKRLFGRLLSWMQQNERACFIFATANDISQLPPEFFRSGRFDALFSVFMPTCGECLDIFREQMSRAGQRRRDAAEEAGVSLENPELFDSGKDGCFSDSCLGGFMRAVTNRGSFLTGADITKLVMNALSLMDAEKLRGPIHASDWKSALTAALDDPTMSTYGSNPANLDKVAVCYLRLLRGSFVPASDAAELLFRPGDYRAVWDAEHRRVRAECTPRSEDSIADPYDRALYRAIFDHMERLADGLENLELRRSVNG